MAKVCPLFSGSSGNSTYVGAGSAGVLVDAGVSARRLTEALCALSVEPAAIAAIFLTHEHKDHIAGLRVFAARHHTPVFGSEGTLRALLASGDLNGVEAYVLDVEELAVGDFCVRRFATSHDAAQSWGYRITLPDGRAVSVCTDLGFVSAEVRAALCGSTAVVLESNHDPEMLSAGPYPAYLKERIFGRTGHLSNPDAAAELPGLVRAGATRFILAHLSEENNRPALARGCALQSLAAAGMREGRDYLLTVAPRQGGQPVLL